MSSMILNKTKLKALWHVPLHTPVFGLYGEVPLEKVWFFGLAVLNMVYNFTRLYAKQSMYLWLHDLAGSPLSPTTKSKSASEAIRREESSAEAPIKCVCIFSLVLNRVLTLRVLSCTGCLEYFCAKQAQDFKPSAAALYPDMGHVTSTPFIITWRCLAWQDRYAAHYKCKVNPIKTVAVDFLSKCVRFRREDEFNYVRLKLREDIFPAHHIVLAANDDYFHTLFI